MCGVYRVNLCPRCVPCPFGALKTCYMHINIIICQGVQEMCQDLMLTEHSPHYVQGYACIAVQ